MSILEFGNLIFGLIFFALSILVVGLLVMIIKATKEGDWDLWQGWTLGVPACVVLSLCLAIMGVSLYEFWVRL